MKRIRGSRTSASWRSRHCRT